MTSEYDSAGVSAFLKTIGATESTFVRDMFGMVLGKMLGRGVDRVVFANALNPDVVFKFETGWAGTGSTGHQNVMEWEIWQWAQGSPSEKWLAPCVDLSANGAILIQKRTRPISRNRLPDRVPSWLTDLKAEHWGLFEGRPVCHDYGVNLALDRAMRSKATKKAEWWDDDWG